MTALQDRGDLRGADFAGTSAQGLNELLFAFQRENFGKEGGDVDPLYKVCITEQFPCQSRLE